HRPRARGDPRAGAAGGVADGAERRAKAAGVDGGGAGRREVGGRTVSNPLGGYRDADVAAADVRAAADFAVVERARLSARAVTLNAILRAERQVVAGANYRLCLDVVDAGQATMVRVVVYRDPQHRYSLTTWEVSRCAER